MRRALIALAAMVLTCALWASYSTVTVTLTVVNPDGTYPRAITPATATVTTTTATDPRVLTTVFTGSYSATTGTVTWTLPANSEVRFVVPAVGINYTVSLGASATYSLNALVPITPSSVPGWAATAVTTATLPLVISNHDISLPGVLTTANTGVTTHTTYFDVPRFTTATLPTPTQGGPVVYDTTANTLKYWDGSWKTLATTAGLGAYLPLAGGQMAQGAGITWPMDVAGVSYVLAGAAGGDAFSFVRSAPGPSVTEVFAYDPSAGLTTVGNAIWNAGNDGAASGLDADTVDGSHAAAFAASSHAHAGADITSGNISTLRLPIAAADLGAADVSLNIGNTNGAFDTSLTLDGTLAAGAVTSGGSAVLTAEADTLASVTGRGATTTNAVTVGDLQSGAAGADGKLTLYSEQGATDYTATLNPNAAMTASADFYLPAAKPASTYLLNMTSGGVIGYDTSTYLTSEADTLTTVLGRNATSSTVPTFSGGTKYGTYAGEQEYSIGSVRCIAATIDGSNTLSYIAYRYKAMGTTGGYERCQYSTSGLDLYSEGTLRWSNGDAFSNTQDVGMARSEAGKLRISDASTGIGALFHALSVEAVTTTKAPSAAESREVYTNEGDADGATITLPTAAAGLTYTAIVQAAQTLTITAASGDTIRIAASVTAAAGSISSNTVGNAVTLTAINATEWVATSAVGTWSF